MLLAVGYGILVIMLKARRLMSLGRIGRTIGWEKKGRMGNGSMKVWIRCCLRQIYLRRFKYWQIDYL